MNFSWPIFELTWGGPDRDWWWFLISFWEADNRWTYLGKEYRNRRWAIERDYYDGPFVQVKLWFFTVSWRTPWTKEAAE